MNLRYLTGALISLPLLPVLFFQGKRIMDSVPKLPEAAGDEGKAKAPTSNEKSLTLLVLGESTMAGVGVHTHEEGFAGALAKELSELLQTSIRWKVYAKTGYTAKKLTSRMVPEISEKPVDLIVVGLGANDAFALNSPGRWRRHVCQLIASLKDRFPTAMIVFCNVPPIKEFPAFTPLIKFVMGNLVEMLGEELNDLAKDYENVHYFSAATTMQDWEDQSNGKHKKSDFFSDGMHPSPLAYQMWARDMAKWIWENEIVFADRP